MKFATRGHHPAAWFSLVALPLTTSCGANIQAVYEGDVRFEHCMALDLQPEMRTEVRRDCWREWTAHYTYGQTRDRIVHASQRLDALGQH